ncbi:MAG: hypothetical protein GVY34_03840 [Alphaproteobacteria bacterium]|jgi:hypothetical protein|nr:hypothetical protein [Alphaproteobacteria bacterium]
MKPNFALGLTEHGITLWMRDADDWLRVGAVAMDAPDQDTRMQALVAKARALTSETVVTKLVIPDEQILYTRLDVAPDPKAIRAALDGRTPYPVEELDFDWVDDNGSVLVAVVARETLVEAEDFAKSQGLNPVCFVAAPEVKGFAREPFFKSARGVSADPEDLGRGGPILRETGHVRTPEASEPIETAPKDAKPSKQDTSKPRATPPVASEPAQRSADPATTDTGTGTGTAPDKAEPARVATAAKTPGASPQAAPVKAKPGARPDAPSKPAAGQAQTADAAVGFRSRRKPPQTAQAVSESSAAKSVSAPAPVARPSETLKALSNTSKLSLGRLGGAALAGKLRASVAEPVARAGSGLRSATDALGRSLAPKAKTENAASTAKDTATAPALSESSGPGESGAAMGGSGKGKAAGKKAKQKQGKTRNAPARKGAAKRQQADPEADRLTVFGARRMSAAAEPTLPRRALLVSGAALLLVLAIAVWVFYFTRTSDPDSAAPVLPADTASEVSAPDPLALEDLSADSANDIEAALGVTDAAQDQGGLPNAGAQEDGIQTERPADDQPPTVASADQDAGRLAALRSVRALAPQSPGDLPSVQDAPEPFGSRELPPLRDVATPDVAQDTVQDDAVATAAPALPPGEEALEIVVTNGAPASVPPARPAGIAPDPTPEPDPDPAEQVVVDESTLDIDVTQSTPPSVPPARPDGIAPEAAPAAPDAPDNAQQPDAAADAEDEQASRAVPPGGVALTALTPAARPAEIVEAAVVQAERFASATPQAVAASQRPSNRPSGFSQTVQRALAAAQARQSAAPEPEIVQASAASVAPRIPSSASVSRAATQTRAINPRKMNLLGVMGTPSARRALVRLGSGRVVTVKVGARLDGGQVTAIGDSELRYNKRGRDLVLRIAS